MLGFLRSGFAATVLGLAFVTACDDSSGGGGEPCDSSAPRPTFVLTVLAPQGALPYDLKLDARYGGGSESFGLAHPAAKHEVLFCDVERGSDSNGLGGKGGAASAPPPHGGFGGTTSRNVEKIVCELWADSAVTVTLTGTGYEESQVDLEPDVDDDCGVVTKSVEAVLVPEAQAEES
jgi:hypothetical protein